ncbi:MULTISPECIES: daunorubicin resistance protein DrrA family ABC transporter ATP-binding protein [Streptacidiphilus]|uniref:Daunorubicin resistance protein DrrA family ABC transporter ATP-binding protein n=1 Tax=Streptacidiphilus cavernicola TaxID=3342716 RepID=A0ABV6V1T4_9ACTN|nr:daunorubicin resistance protein DrrA family ABC transporter ATP-binding protein [Streptacidiphilus jeojiense]
MKSSCDLAVHAAALTKTFGPTRALNGVDLSVPAGSVYGFLGPNGAGKTTTLRILATLLRPDAGAAQVLGHDVVREPDAVRARISLAGQFASVDEDLTGSENLRILGRLQGHRPRAARARAQELIEAFGLVDAADRPVKTYSGGMRRRLDLAGSLTAAPDLIFLDEPTTGLDPAGRTQVWAIVRALADQGTTILLTTQYLDEADQLAARIAVIDHGRVIAEGTPGQLRESVGSSTLHIRLTHPEQRPEAARTLERVFGLPVHLDANPAALSVSGRTPHQAATALADLCRDGTGVAGFSLGRPSLDEVFLALTAHSDSGQEHVA